MPRARLSTRLRTVLRTSLGFALLGFLSSFCGAGVVFLLLVLQGIPQDVDGRGWVLAVSAAGYVGLSVLVGGAWGGFLQRRTVVWFLFGRAPTPDEAARALRLPVDLAVVSGTLWFAGTVALGTLAGALGSSSDALGVGLTILLGGLTTVGLTYLAAEWVSRPVMTLALDVVPLRDRLPTTVLTRLVLTWSLASGVPLLGVLLVVLPPDVGDADPRYALLSLAVLGIVVGALATALLARGVAAPLHRLRLALDAIGRGPPTPRSGSTTRARSGCCRPRSTTWRRDCANRSGCVTCSAGTSAPTSRGTRWSSVLQCPATCGR